MDNHEHATFDSSKTRRFKIRFVFGKIYNCISVLSTLSIFSCVLYFVISAFTQIHVSDNDIIMREIEAQLNNGEKISQLYTCDLHGFGNNSIVVVARSSSKSVLGEDLNNRLIIFDPIETQFYNKLHDPFGVKSKFTTTFSFELSYEFAGLIPYIENISDICGDIASEIVVSFENYGSTYGSKVFAIFSYSYEDQEYNIVATYPIPQKHDCYIYDENNKIVGSQGIQIDGNPYSLDYKDRDALYECSDGEYTYYLNEYSGESVCNYWIDGYLVSIIDDDEDDSSGISDSTDYDLVNIYQPFYIDNEFSWNVVYSEYTNKINIYSNELDINKYFENHKTIIL